MLNFHDFWHVLEGHIRNQAPNEFGCWLIAEDYKTAAEKFSRDNPEADREAIKKYLSDFKKIATKKFKQMFDDIRGVGVPKEKRTDVDAYKTFAELEALVDHVRGQVPVHGNPHFGEGDIEVDIPPVFENDKIVVYYGDTPRACIKYKGSVPYSWCVARKDSGNLFYTYRFKDHEPAFYFVKNKEKTKKEFGLWNIAQTAFSGKFKDPWHFFVVQTVKGADPTDQKKRQYFLTSANNDGDVQSSWSDIIKKEPELEGHQEVFKSVPLAEDEREDRKLFSKGISDEDFAKLSYEKKNRYLDIRVGFDSELTDAKFKSLPEDLRNKYMGFGLGLSDAQYEMIRGTKLEKRYREVTLEKAKRLLKGEFDGMGIDDDSPYALKGSEMDAIKGQLDYKGMSLENIGRLAGIWSEPEEYEDDEGILREKGDWNGSIPDPATGELLDRYMAAKGELPHHEMMRMKDIHPSQTKVLDMHGDKEPSTHMLKAIFEKNFVRNKGFKEERVKEAFERKRKEILAKDEISSDEMDMISKYSEDPDATIAGIKDSALKGFFASVGAISWVAHAHPGAAKKVIERLERLADKLPPHPLLLAYAPDLKSALERMGGTEAIARMNNEYISKSFLGNRGDTPPERMQEIAELVLSSHGGPLGWMILGLVKRCPDPNKALVAAAGNPRIFERISEWLETVTELIEFLNKGVPDEVKQPVKEAIAKSMSTRSFTDSALKTLFSLLRSAPNKGRIMQSVGNKGMKAFALSYYWPFMEMLEKMPKEQAVAAKEALDGIGPEVSNKISTIIMGTPDYLKSIGPDKMDDMQMGIVASDPSLTPKERTHLADEIIKTKARFDIESRPKGVVGLIAHSSDKQWALRTVLSKAGNLSFDKPESFLFLLGYEHGAPFPGNEFQKAAEIILSFKDRLSNGDLVSILNYSPDKERTAGILGKDKVKELAERPAAYSSEKHMFSLLREKGLMG
jgi:hypothetical protein